MWQFSGQRRPEFALQTAENQESVWDDPQPPICVPDSREVIVSCGERTLARTTSAIRVLETASPPTFYLPRRDVRLDLLERSAGNSFCEWKGAVTYWSLVLKDQRIKNIAWSYETPSLAFESIRGYLSFYPAKLECTVDGEIVRPQSGGFYGGWVTNEIVGPFKGDRGTLGW